MFNHTWRATPQRAVLFGLPIRYVIIAFALDVVIYSFQQTWGIEELEGDRRYIRHVKFTGPKAEDIELRIVYDYGKCALPELVTEIELSMLVVP